MIIIANFHRQKDICTTDRTIIQCPCKFCFNFRFSRKIKKSVSGTDRLPDSFIHMTMCTNHTVSKSRNFDPVVESCYSIVNFLHEVPPHLLYRIRNIRSCRNNEFFHCTYTGTLTISICSMLSS